MTVPAIATSTSLGIQLDEGIHKLGLVVDAAMQAQLLQYVALLEKWNKVYNLTAVREAHRMIGTHILDSLAVVPHVGATSLIDVGTGGGLPGIPLAIAKPDLRVCMLDTIAKKTTFVRQAIADLRLTNAEVVTARVETFTPPTQFEVVISRAFAELKDFVDGAGHLCAEGGQLIAMKGVHPHDEIARLPASHVVEKIIALNVPFVEGQRHLIVIRKRPVNQ